MAELIECVLEGIPPRRVFELLEEMIGLSQGVIRHQCTEDMLFFPKGRLSQDAVTTFLALHSSQVLILFLKQMKIGGRETFDTQILLINHRNQYRIEWNIEVPSLDKNRLSHLVPELHKWCKNTASSLGIKHFYGGMEPADDKDTRFFTNDQRGPLVF